ncbi:hypothetical protein FB382_004374 [Nocardioides ginsengisegetis]|uniref:Uncharacterized protein n=1 Tax=Nocardioides ginsengisegetis TaxID=661491 RepID=A0A7W3PBT2_9ACTN|nr:hypothetical protein [Nocardioides ginsengisegetis]MBA8805599.1 hypothetical protein [Nocardioides ginsengisegetis]MBA8806023.1 hypothetical protein [Nocardioides ginsengisegetis]
MSPSVSAADGQEAERLGNSTKPNPDQPARCPSIDPHDTLQCARRIHEDDQCVFGGIGWKKGERPQRDVPAFLYHWSPARNRISIEREGLRPGSPSNTFPEWSPPHICYGETPASALGLTLLPDELDLWMVRTDSHRFTLANEGAEWRSADQIEAWWVGGRPPRDPVIDMTPAEQAEADEIVAYLHEQEIAERRISPETHPTPTTTETGTTTGAADE